MFAIKSLKLKVIGFWDQCFFRQIGCFAIGHQN